MEYCHYHPRISSTFFCGHCHKAYCDKCVDDENGLENSVCFLCQRALESLGAGGTVEPFWRRLQESFKYPLNSDGLFIIVAATLVPMLLSGMPIWGLISLLFFTGALLKYCFTCLMRTAMGNFIAPHVREGYEGGAHILFSLIVISLLTGALVIGSYMVLGMAMGSLMGAAVIILLPAILIRFAQSESLLDALNPILALRIVTTIGLPYGLLLAFIIIMMSSVGVLHSFFDFFLPKAAPFCQSLTTNYYLIVIFHLMGYMLFQFQRELGYSARLDAADVNTRPAIARRLAKIEVLIKAGEYEKAIGCFEEGLKAQPNELRLWDEYMEFLYATKKPELIGGLANRLLEALLKLGKDDKLLSHFKRIRFQLQEYIPQSPLVRFNLASLLYQQGDFKTAVQLLNGLHKSHPQFDQLVAAYELMAQILEEQPIYKAQAIKCREMIEQLKRKAEMAAAEKTAEVEQVRKEIERAFVKPVKNSLAGSEVPEKPAAQRVNKQQRAIPVAPSWDLVPIEKPAEPATEESK